MILQLKLQFVKYSLNLKLPPKIQYNGQPIIRLTADCCHCLLQLLSQLTVELMALQLTQICLDCNLISQGESRGSAQPGSEARTQLGTKLGMDGIPYRGIQR